MSTILKIPEVSKMLLNNRSSLGEIFVWVWEQYRDDIFNTSKKAAWEQVDWENCTSLYRDRIQRLYGWVQQYGQAQPMLLDKFYTAINVLGFPTAWRRVTLDEIEGIYEEELTRYFYTGFVYDLDEKQDGLALVCEGKNLFIFGKPGAGKTTFLKYISLQFVMNPLGRVPVFVSLKHLSDSGLTTFEYVRQEFDACGFPNSEVYLDRLLKSGKAILLFDGLDEVSAVSHASDRLIKDVKNFTRKYESCQRLITCRVSTKNIDFQGYSFVEIADFDREQIYQCIDKWFAGSIVGLTRSSRLFDELMTHESEGLREIARVPLLLTQLCMAIEELPDLSQQRVKLYKESVESLRNNWYIEHSVRHNDDYRSISLKEINNMLAEVAAETFFRREYFFTRERLTNNFEALASHLPSLTESMDGDAILQVISDQGIIIEVGRDIFSFAHLSFQEYLTSRYISKNAVIGTFQLLITRYWDWRFQEVFNLTATQLPEESRFFEQFQNRLTDDVRRHPAVEALLRHSDRKASKLATEIKIAAARCLYLSLLRTHDTILALDVDKNFALERARARAGALDIEPPINLAQAIVRDRDLARDLNLPLELDLDFNLLRTRSYVRSKQLDLDPVLALALKDDLDIDQKQNRDLTYVMPNRGIFSLSHAFARARMADFDTPYANDLSESLERSLRVVRNIARKLHYTSDGVLARDISIVYCQICISVANTVPSRETQLKWISAAEEFASKAGMHANHQDEPIARKQLAELIEMLQRYNTAGDWETIVRLDEKLEAVMQAFDIHPPNLDSEDMIALRRYLEGNRLLLACLKQAPVPDREAIEDKLLLLPPEE